VFLRGLEALLLVTTGRRLRTPRRVRSAVGSFLRSAESRRCRVAVRSTAAIATALLRSFRLPKFLAFLCPGPVGCAFFVPQPLGMRCGRRTAAALALLGAAAASGGCSGSPMHTRRPPRAALWLGSACPGAPKPRQRRSAPAAAEAQATYFFYCQSCGRLPGVDFSRRRPRSPAPQAFRPTRSPPGSLTRSTAPAAPRCRHACEYRWLAAWSRPCFHGDCGCTPRGIRQANRRCTTRLATPCPRSGGRCYAVSPWVGVSETDVTPAASLGSYGGWTTAADATCASGSRLVSQRYAGGGALVSGRSGVCA
jgi:hypothetical protein